MLLTAALRKPVWAILTILVSPSGPLSFSPV
jgi:hypothetical protein